MPRAWGGDPIVDSSLDMHVTRNAATQCLPVAQLTVTVMIHTSQQIYQMKL
jgi:hypothetical protein